MLKRIKSVSPFVGWKFTVAPPRSLAWIAPRDMAIHGICPTQITNQDREVSKLLVLLSTLTCRASLPLSLQRICIKNPCVLLQLF